MFIIFILGLSHIFIIFNVLIDQVIVRL